MFLGIEKHDLGRIAAKDMRNEELTYNDLLSFANTIAKELPERELGFCLCRNTIGALAGYYAFYENKNPVLLLDANLQMDTVKSFILEYSPAFLWFPCDMDFDGIEILSAHGYRLIKTGLRSPHMHDQLSFLLTTSGSTGSPKLVRHKYGNLEHNAEVVAEAFGWTVADNGICHLPMQYTMGLSVINSLLCAGSSVLLCDGSLASSDFWRFIKENKATSFTGVPYSYDILFKLKFMRMDLPYLRVLASGGGKLSEDMFMELANYAQKSGRQFFSTFGATETSARLAYLPPELATGKTLSIGKAFRDGELYLLAPNGNILQDTVAEGELVYKGKNVTMGYANTVGDLSKGDEWNGKYKLGDIARRDEDGCYYIIGRTSRFLKLYGHRISLDSTEALITKTFNISCACIGTDEQMDIFVANSDIEDEISQFMAENTGLPRKVFHILSTGEIPRKSNGKVDYQKLMEMQ